MPCIIVSKEKIVPFGKRLFIGGGHSWGGSFKKFNVFGGVMKKMSKVRKIPPLPSRDFINERSLRQSQRNSKGECISPSI